ncbi:MAG TPA: serine--tRNA ligase, partial [Armatimonadota bacterium]
ELDDRLEGLLLQIPNPCHESVPVGPDESGNVVIRSWGSPQQPAFELKPHWVIAEAMDILDLERATKITGVGGVGFTLLKGQGARLMRGLMNFMLDLHTTKHGYREIWPPSLVARSSMVGTSQLPKFEDDAYHTDKDDLFLIPTAEVPVTNLHREEILEGSQLPLYYTAYTPCFRREAGAAGRDTRGLLRTHQFDKVEMVKVCRPETSYDELEKLLADAEEVLQLLEIPYRVLLLCTGDTPFGNAKTYDLEVWAGGVKAWLEVSSCSNTESYQARRAGIRYRSEKGAKPDFVHTLNGSGLAFPRVIAALLENNQREDGTVDLPAALVPYMGGVARLTG